MARGKQEIFFPFLVPEEETPHGHSWERKHSEHHTISIIRGGDRGRGEGRVMLCDDQLINYSNISSVQKI